MRISDTFIIFFGRSRDSKILLTEIASKLWDNKLLIFKWEIIGVIIGLIICFSIPKEYTTKILFCLEKDSKLINIFSDVESTLLQLMDMNQSPDAYSENLYAFLIDSPKFKYDLLNIQFSLPEEENNIISLRDYLNTKQQEPWWNYIIKYPSSIISRISDNKNENLKGTWYMPSFSELELIDELQHHISLSKIESTGMMELEVELQNPYVAALVADSICTRLNRYINNYRKSKAIARFQFSDSIYEQSKRNYYKTQDEYAFYLDTHQGISHKSDKITLERLKFNRDVAYKVYMGAAVLRQADKNSAIVDKPIYHIVQPTYMAPKASSPKKLVILSYCMFLFAFFPCLWIIYKNLNDSNSKI